uniref:Uncharacterized protein n=1 Tax=Anguilla anguilla TaxID=7936 RepID=A0A0E9XCM4_ANGAN
MQKCVCCVCNVVHFLLSTQSSETSAQEVDSNERLAFSLHVDSQSFRAHRVL